MKMYLLLPVIVCLLLPVSAAQAQWNLTGNTGTVASTNFIGTTDNVNLKIRTNNQVRINITGNGKVGIGNFSPVFRLDVKGGSTNTDSMYRISGVQVISRNNANHIQVGDGFAKVGIGTSTPTSALDVNGDVTVSGFLSAFGGSSVNWNTAYAWGNHASVGYITMETDPQVGLNTTNYVPRWNGASLVTGTIYDNGNVGIGTTNPLARFQVTHASTITDPQIRIHQSNADFARINFTNNSISNYWTVAAKSVTTNSQSRLNFYNSIYGDVMSLTGDGNVCIGTGTPATGYKLSVQGKIISEEMKVMLHGNWPDYVFDDTYPLMPLDELKNHLQLNKHLPGLPSASEIEMTQGFEIGHMQQKLLEKVEELTLYIIKQQDEINAIKKQPDYNR